jgi:hypothetical protein
MILGLCATRRRALEEQTTFFAHYYIQYVSDGHCQTKRA